MQQYEKLLLANKTWAKNKLAEDPGFFERLVHIQRPEFLWIGCSDSRVPPNEITQTHPGEIFIHRNIANLVIHTDMNMLSVLQYAVEVLEVNHIVVCGHYGCGGVKSAMSRHSFGLINKWLRHIKDIYRLHHSALTNIESEEARLNKLIELNIVEQVNNLADTSIVQRAWKKRQAPHLHGWVYDLHNGIINPLVEIPAGSRLEHEIYEYDNLND
ncbi:MAG: carbonate dehydratase [Saprospirales bacterium]|nr:carbonate dehydratase [Saprospirales bacterium]MBK8923117.1 carbonate dehydratase [Saprospirales bacterium]